MNFVKAIQNTKTGTRLQKSINNNISFCKIKIIIKSSTRLANTFRFKDKKPFCLHSNIVYKFACSRYNATYYDENCRHFKVRVGEHSGISPLAKNGPNQITQQLLKTFY